MPDADDDPATGETLTAAEPAAGGAGAETVDDTTPASGHDDIDNTATSATLAVQARATRAGTRGGDDAVTGETLAARAASGPDGTGGDDAVTGETLAARAASGPEASTAVGDGTTAAASGAESTVSAAQQTVASITPGVESTVSSGGGTWSGAGALPVVDPRRYGERSELARGGMGRISTARDRVLCRRVALKELRADTPELRARFEREALLTARLEHPSIVGIHEAGTWPGGEPFYAMRLVAGEPLERRIARATTFAERVALLPNMLAVADAIAYAHQQRVIHRDLKPHNVLVGEFGETVVIDWGLAKSLDDDTTTGAGAGGVASGDAAATTVGDVLGTPAYMPPEQADGEPVDERADVYAIGAVLYHVLAGRPPYSGTSAQAVLDAVRREPPPAIADVEPSTPPDLRAIVERAMARDRTERYASARGLAEDLRRFQAGQLVGAHHYTLRQRFARLVRRHRTAFAVGGLAVLSLAVVGAISIRQIMQERRAAVAARDDAEHLAGFMLNDLRKQLESINRLELLEPIANAADAYYAQRPIADANPDELQQRGSLMIALGDVAAARHDGPTALTRFQSGLALRERVVELAPTDEAERELGIAERKVAAILYEQGDRSGALRLYQRNLERGERRLARLPDDLDALRAVSSAHSGLAMANPDHTRAVAEARAAAATIERAAKLSPGPEWDRLRADTQQLIGDTVKDHDPAAAFDAYRDAFERYERLAEARPNAEDLQAALAMARVRLAESHRRRGERSDATLELQRAVATLAHLSERDPGNLRRERTHAVANHQLASLLAADDDLGEALNRERTAIAIFERIAKADPRSVKAWHDLAVGHQNLGKLMRKTDPEAALLALGEARRILEDPARPKTAARTRELAVTLTFMAETEVNRGNAATAVAMLRDARTHVQQLMAEAPSNARRMDLVANHLEMAHAFGRDRAADARAELGAAAQLVDRVLADEPDNLLFRRIAKAIADERERLE